MNSLSRKNGIFTLLGVAFDLGNLFRVISFIRIKGLIRRGHDDAALKACTQQIQSSRRVVSWQKSGSPMHSVDINLMIGELLYTLGGKNSAIERVLLPLVRTHIENQSWSEARIILDEILLAYPECAEAQSLLSNLLY